MSAFLFLVPGLLLSMSGAAAWFMAWRNYRLAEDNYREAARLLEEIKKP